jgi:ribosome-associated protein
MTERESKSQKKREMNALNALGEQLALLNEVQLGNLMLPEALSDALIEAKRITSHVARKRHFQHIGSILRAMDPEEVSALSAAIDTLKQAADCNSAQFHRVEKWRDRFLEHEPDVLTLFLKAYPCDDIQQLRQVIKQAQKEQASQQNLGGAKALFRLIRSIIVSAELNQR